MANNKPQENKITDYNEDYYEEEAGRAAYNCGCSPGFCFPWRARNNSGTGSERCLLREPEEIAKESWLVEKVKKLKEVSEIEAGSKWKNFIRRFSGAHNKTKRRRTQFQYDPHGYALNFDDGIDKEVDGGNYLDFSARFSAPIGMNKG